MKSRCSDYFKIISHNYYDKISELHKRKCHKEAIELVEKLMLLEEFKTCISQEGK